MKRWLIACFGLFLTGIFLVVVGLVIAGPDNRAALQDHASPVGQILPQGDAEVPVAQPPGAGEINPTSKSERRVGEPASR